MPVAGVSEHHLRRVGQALCWSWRIVASNIGASCPKSGAALVISAAKITCRSLTVAWAL